MTSMHCAQMFNCASTRVGTKISPAWRHQKLSRFLACWNQVFAQGRCNVWVGKGLISFSRSLSVSVRGSQFVWVALCLFASPSLSFSFALFYAEFL